MTGHLGQVTGSGNAKEGVSPRAITEGGFTGQDDSLDVWAVAGGGRRADSKVSSQSD